MSEPKIPAHELWVKGIIENNIELPALRILYEMQNEKYKKLLNYLKVLSLSEYSTDELEEMLHGRDYVDALIARKARILLNEIGELE